jgi:hypothetical protein
MVFNQVDYSLSWNKTLDRMWTEYISALREHK